MISLFGLATALILQMPAFAQTDSSSLPERECFSKLQPLAPQMSIQLAKDDFLMDDGASLWRISADGISQCPFDSKAVEAAPLTYLRVKTKDSEALVAHTSLHQRDFAERRNGDLPAHVQPGFRPLSKIEKTFIKLSNIVTLTCTPVADLEKAKAEIRKEMVGRLKLAEMMLKVKNLASVLPLVKDPDFAAYQAAATECSKVPGDVSEHAKLLGETAQRLAPKNRPDKKTDKVAR